MMRHQTFAIVVLFITSYATLLSAQSDPPSFAVLDIEYRIVDPDLRKRLSGDSVRELLVVSDEFVLRLSRVGESKSISFALLEKKSKQCHQGNLGSEMEISINRRGMKLGSSIVIANVLIENPVKFLESDRNIDAKRKQLNKRIQLINASKDIVRFKLNSLDENATTIELFDKQRNIKSLCQSIVKSEFKLSGIRKILQNK